MSRQQIQSVLDLKGEEHFRTAYLKPALKMAVVEMTRPDKPRSSNQRYRLTALGRQWLDTHPAGWKTGGTSHDR
jgi:ATP-dependent DNA helicase RecG